MASAVPAVKVADCIYNVRQIEDLVIRAEGKGVEVIVFPELCITGYSCQELFRQNLLLEQAEAAVMMLLDFTRNLDIISIVGVPVVINNQLLNCAAVIQKGEILGIVPKTYLPNYCEFYEKRWFVSSLDIKDCEVRFAGNKVKVFSSPVIFRTCDGAMFGVEICEDVWAPVPPSSNLACAGADIIFNLSASDELVGKHKYLKSLLEQQSARIISGYVYSSCGFGESTQDVVYGGNALIYENGCLIEENERFCMQPQLVISQIDVEKHNLEDHPEIVECFSHLPGLEPRTVAFHIRQDRLEVFPSLFEKAYRNDFDLYTRQQILDLKLFGENSCERMHEFIGDYLAVAKGNISLLYGAEDKTVKGDHAGGRKEEAMVPLILYSGKKTYEKDNM